MYCLCMVEPNVMGNAVSKGSFSGWQRIRRATLELVKGSGILPLDLISVGSLILLRIEDRWSVIRCERPVKGVFERWTFIVVFDWNSVFDRRAFGREITLESFGAPTRRMISTANPSLPLFCTESVHNRLTDVDVILAVNYAFTKCDADPDWHRRHNMDQKQAKDHG